MNFIWMFRINVSSSQQLNKKTVIVEEETNITSSTGLDSVPMGLETLEEFIQGPTLSVRIPNQSKIRHVPRLQPMLIL